MPSNRLNFRFPFLSFLLILQHLHISHSAHILFFSSIPSYSHRVGMFPLADALSKRGHQITFINPFSPRTPHINPNFTEIVPRAMAQYMQDWLSTDSNINNRVNDAFTSLAYTLFPSSLRSCKHLFDSPELAEFYKKTKSLDLVLIDNCPSECGLALAYKYGAKHAIYHTVTHYPHEYDLRGFLPESSAIPEYDIKPVKAPLGFWDRVVNSLSTLHFRWEHWKYMWELDTLVRDHLQDPQMPFMDDVVRNACLAFYVGDVLSDYPRSHAPFFVNIGGIYCAHENKKLPKDLQDFMNAPNSDGVVYISFGTLAISSDLPESFIQVFWETIRQMPRLRFIWKWDSPVPKDKPENVYLSKWLPQRDLLGDSRVKTFVTQSGRPSMMEALCNAVPCLAMPVLGDQDIIANRMNEMGANVKLELRTVTTEQLVAALQKTVYDTRMKERLVELQTVLLDRPIPALENAVWWVEYIIRTKDTSHLKPAGFHQWWFQRRLLDVWAFVFVVISIGVFSVIFTLIYIFKKLFCKRTRDEKRVKSKRS